jgi:hypothetical protein
VIIDNDSAPASMIPANPVDILQMMFADPMNRRHVDTIRTFCDNGAVVKPFRLRAMPRVMPIVMIMIDTIHSPSRNNPPHGIGSRRTILGTCSPVASTSFPAYSGIIFVIFVFHNGSVLY